MSLTIEKSFITYEYAIKLIQAAIGHAKTQGLSICVAVVDSVGNLIAFAKMDDSCLIGISTAQGKAYTASRSGLSTRDFHAYLNDNDVSETSLQDAKLMLIPGGFPIFHQEKLIGGIGIGGGTGQQDEECAKIALQSLVLYDA